MKKLIFLMLFLGSEINGLSQTSHIQVVSESGISIFLDGQFIGITSSDLGGLIIQNIPYGQHAIKVVKDGYLPREESINIKAGEVFTYQVDKNFTPTIRISEQGNKENQAISIKKGHLKFQSLPIGINISIPSLGINTTKSQDEWLARDIPEGNYEVTFIWNAKKISESFEIKNEMLTYALVNMVDEKIENKSITPLINSPPIISINPEIKAQKDTEKVFNKNFFIGLIGFLGALIIVPLLFK